MTTKEFFDLYKTRKLRNNITGRIFVVAGYDPQDEGLMVKELYDHDVHSKAYLLRDIQRHYEPNTTIIWNYTFNKFGEDADWLYSELDMLTFTPIETKADSNWICDVCKNPAYIGFMKIECPNKCYG